MVNPSLSRSPLSSLLLLPLHTHTQTLLLAFRTEFALVVVPLSLDRSLSAEASALYNSDVNKACRGEGEGGEGSRRDCGESFFGGQNAIKTRL